MAQVLLAADELGCLLRIATLLRASEYEIEICNEGPRFAEMAERTMPDLGVLSATLPLWDAFAIGRQLKQNPSTSHIPLLILSHSWGEIAAQTKAGLPEAADAFMAEPWDDQALALRMRELEALGRIRRTLVQREFELAALRHVSQTVVGVPDLSALLDAALETIVQVLGCDAGAIYLYDASRGALDLSVAEGVGDDLARLVRRIPLAPALADLVASRAGATVGSTADFRHDFIRPALVSAGYAQVGTVALLANGQLMGVAAFAARGTQPIPERQLQLVTAIGQQLGLALKSAALYDELQRERDLAQSMLDTMAEGLLLQDEQGLITFANPAMCRILGADAAHLRGSSLCDVVLPSEKESVRAELARCVAEGGGRFETTLLSQDGRPIPVLVNAAPLYEDGRLRGALAAFTDIAALKEAELASRESEERYRVLAEESPFGILMVQGQQVVYANRRIREWWPQPLSLEAALARLRSAEQAALNAWLRGHEAGESPDPIEFQIQHPVTALDHWVVLRGSAVRYGGREALLITVVDVTEQKRADQALLRTERLRALGQMAGGIAHNFNNILTGIQGYLDMTRLDADRPEALREDLRNIELGTRDAVQAVRRMQSLYRILEDTSDFVPLRLEALVEEAIAFTAPRWRDEASLRGATVQVVADLAETPAVRGNAGELREVLTNLIFNAVDAMPRGGILRLATAVEDQVVALTVADTGMGMDEQQLRRVFEPFYTTKGATGSGLGLSISQRIIERHGGRISVQSQVGAGTTFAIRLPIAPVIPVPIAPAAAPRSLSSGNRILVVDDEKVVLQLLQRMLERQEQVVTVAASGAEAIALLEREEYDLLITDLGMPVITGAEVARRARELHPGLPIVMATGWGNTISPEQLAELGAAGLLTKPFSYEQLGSLLATLLV